MAPTERFSFCAISRGFIPEASSLRNISSSVSVQGRPAGRGPVISRVRISLRVLNGRYAGRDQRIGWRMKRNRQNESDGETVGDNRNFGIAHRSTSPEKMDHPALRDLSQARFEVLAAHCSAVCVRKDWDAFFGTIVNH